MSEAASWSRLFWGTAVLPPSSWAASGSGAGDGEHKGTSLAGVPVMTLKEKKKIKNKMSTTSTGLIVSS